MLVASQARSPPTLLNPDTQFWGRCCVESPGSSALIQLPIDVPGKAAGVVQVPGALPMWQTWWTPALKMSLGRFWLLWAIWGVDKRFSLFLTQSFKEIHLKNKKRWVQHCGIASKATSYCATIPYGH